MKAIVKAARSGLARKDSPLPASIGFDRGWSAIGNRSTDRISKIVKAINTYGGTDESSATVFACVSLIADTLAGYEFGVTDPEGDLLDPSAADASLHALLEEPWKEATYNDFAGDVQTDLELVGNSYWLKDEMNALGQPFAIKRLPPQQVKIATNRADEKIGYVYRVKGVDIPFTSDEVVHYKLRNPLNPHYGMGTVESIIREVQSDLAQNAHVTAFFTNGARIAGVLTIPDGLDEVQFERLKDEIATEYGSASNAYKMLIAEKSTDFKPITTDPKAAGVVDLRNLAKDDILKGFGVPEFMLGGKAQAGIQKMEQSQYVFYRRMVTRAQRFQDRTSMGIASYWEGRKFVLFPELNEPPDQKIVNAKGLAEACASPNEVRVAAGLPEIDDPRMDMPLLPTALSPLGIVFQGSQNQNPGRNQDPALPGGGDPNDPNGDGEQQQSAPLLEGVKAPRQKRPAHKRRAHPDLKLPPGLPPQVALQPSVAQMITSMVLSGQTNVVEGSAFEVPQSPAVDEAERILALTQGAEQYLLEAGAEGGAPTDAEDSSEFKLLIEAPELPDGYEQRAPLIDPGEADVVQAQQLLQGQAIFFNRATPVMYRTFVQFFTDQRMRVLRGLDDFRSAQGRAKASDRKEVNGDDLWAAEAERAALLAAYMDVVDSLGEAALEMPRRIVSADVQWDLEHEYPAEARARLAEQVVRINETTRKAIADEVAEGVRRGYSIARIANGYVDENYKGIQGIFNDATAVRAETIARTETAYLYNAAASAAYKSKGITQVYVIDGRGDALCAEADGAVWTVEQSESDPIGHPNCVRAFAPKVD